MKVVGKKLRPHIHHSKAIINIWELLKKLTHGELGWWNVKFHHLNSILKKIRIKNMVQ
jgi:hypothetical protein